MRFHSFPATLSTSRPFASSLSHGQSRSSSLIASTFAWVVEMRMQCESIVYPNASIVVPQSVLFFGARIGISPISPGPKSLTWSEANDAHAVSAGRSCESCCTRVSRKSSTYTMVTNGPRSPPPYRSNPGLAGNLGGHAKFFQVPLLLHETSLRLLQAALRHLLTRCSSVRVPPLTT